MKGPRTAIIDIGSNSIRLVVYQGPVRLPAILFNEKVLAGLGRSLAKNGAIDARSLALASAALSRFAALARDMGCDDILTVATAAVRDAANGDAMIDRAKQAGLTVEVLSGKQEAFAAGHGVLSAIPDADGIVGDLGGGSLELVRVANGAIHAHASFPLGVLRVAPLLAAGAFDDQVAKILTDAGWAGSAIDKPFYLVGGSWRSLARVDMHDRNYPLPILHEYRMPAERIDILRQRLAKDDRPWLKSVPHLSGGRIPTLPAAADILGAVLPVIGSTETIVSAYGLREGLLHQRMTPEQAALDPLIVATRDEGRRLGRFPEHGDLLNRWIAPLFMDDTPGNSRLRHATCLLADTCWRANPEFRVELAVETALHGNWVGVDARGRAMMAVALAASLGGQRPYASSIDALATPADFATATAWGLAIRLAQRLSGGVAHPLDRTSVSVREGAIEVAWRGADRALVGEAVEKRLRALGAAMGLPTAVREFT